MGSTISKAVRSQVKADASVAPATSAHHDPTLEPPVCNIKDNTATVLGFYSHDDANIATSTTPNMDSQLRRNSAPMPTGSAPLAALLQVNQQRLDDFEQFLAEQRLMAIEYPAPPQLSDRAPAPLPPPVDPPPQCLICCVDLPKDGSKKALKPCRGCSNSYCTACVKNMFIEACKDSTRMPPRCCYPINLQLAKPYLTEDETSLFRAKYEEWRTPNPTYCPVPVCSAFIPDRLMPQNVRDKKQRADSGVGTPTSESFACPTCEASICTGCRQQAHPGVMCNIDEFGLDADTTALLKSWGYKQCPKCRHGVKRMFGCNHMECRCGAHFCWVCLESINECDGGCYDDDEEDYFSDGEPDEEEDTPVQPTPAETTTEIGASEVPAEAVTENAEVTAPAQPARPRNLDGGGARYWANTEINFGEEPQDDHTQAIWSCDHYYRPYTIPFATALTSHTNEVECTQCWGTAHPTVYPPSAATKKKRKIVTAGTNRAAAFGVRGGRGRGLVRDRGRYAPPRGLFRADATIGTAPHLTVNLPPLPSTTIRDATSMEDVQFSSRIIDTYGTILTTISTPTQPRRRASLDSAEALLQCSKRGIDFNKPNKHTPSVLENTPATFTLAHECEYCFIIVCQKCRDQEVARKEAEQKVKDEEQKREVEDVDRVFAQVGAQVRDLREQQQQAAEQLPSASQLHDTQGSMFGALFGVMDSE
jgi:hypothetical protein